jgi:hypothetical protein
MLDNTIVMLQALSPADARGRRGRGVGAELVGSRGQGQVMGWLRIIGVVVVAVCVNGCVRNWVRVSVRGHKGRRRKPQDG